MLLWLRRLMGLPDEPRLGRRAGGSASLPGVNAPVARRDIPRGRDVGMAGLRAPWDGGGRPSLQEPGQVRIALRSALQRVRDGQRQAPDKAFLQRLVERVAVENLDFPPFPDIALGLDALLRTPEPSIVELVGTVERDPGLVKRVWTASSSTRFARAPTSLHHAVSRIGFDALWRIGMSACLHSPVFRAPGFQEQAAAVRTHCVRVGRYQLGSRGRLAVMHSWQGSCTTLASCWCIEQPVRWRGNRHRGSA